MHLEMERLLGSTSALLKQDSPRSARSPRLVSVNHWPLAALRNTVLLALRSSVQSTPSPVKWVHTHTRTRKRCCSACAQPMTTHSHTHHLLLSTHCRFSQADSEANSVVSAATSRIPSSSPLLLTSQRVGCCWAHPVLVCVCL